MKETKSNSRSGLTLVEIMVAIAIFSIIMLALSGTIIQGLKLRRSNSIESEALAVAASALEVHKNAWADFENYKCFSSTSSAGRSLGSCTKTSYAPAINIPSIFKQDPPTYLCLDRKGVPYPEATCNDADDSFVPELRRVTVTIHDQQNTIRAQLFTEIGNPLP
jgi:prepilin-type N-terminal cleavage/methylation domain-containing protein